VCSLTRDTYFMGVEGASTARIIRVCVSLFLLSLTIFIQAFLLAMVTKYVAARSVSDIRAAYDTFEVTMYGKEHTTLTVNGKHRGIPAFEPPLDEAMKRLNTLTPTQRDDACRIPLSQPTFFGLVLLVWTLTCLAELRKAVNLQMQILMLEKVSSMKYAIIREFYDASESEGIITGMTTELKIAITVVMFIPRLLITLYILYIGSRWLLATSNFSDLIMNAVALEFILLMKDTLYVALMPARSHLDLQITLISPYPRKLRPAWFNYANSLTLLFIAVLWVGLYMTMLQSVLPGYQWDVHDVCEQYIKERYAV
jgi:hypothetical protein